MKLEYLDGGEMILFKDEILTLYPEWTKVSVNVEPQNETCSLVFYGISSDNEEYSVYIDDIELHDHLCLQNNGMLSYILYTYMCVLPW